MGLAETEAPVGAVGGRAWLVCRPGMEVPRPVGGCLLAAGGHLRRPVGVPGADAADTGALEGGVVTVDDPVMRRLLRLQVALMCIRDLRYEANERYNTAPKRLALAKELAREALREGQPCADCGLEVAAGEGVALQDVLCDDCGHARAHQTLYGHEECRDCGRQLGPRDTTRCAECDGVEDLHEEDDGDGAGACGDRGTGPQGDAGTVEAR